jgi:hypothetical protein
VHQLEFGLCKFQPNVPDALGLKISMLFNSLNRTLAQRFALTQLQRWLMLGLVFPCLISGCTSITQLTPISSAPLQLTIQQVKPESRGSYAVSGNTTLPDQARIAVAAIRYFKTGPAGSSNYTVLDRQIAEVNQGAWETRLSLQQAAATGQLQEAWQTSPDLSQLTEPEPTVTFVAALEPTNQPINLKKQVEALDPAAQAALVRFTTDGELYLQASKTLAVPPPPGRPTPITSKLLQPQIVKPTLVSTEAQPVQPQTDAPLPLKANLR